MPSIQNGGHCAVVLDYFLTVTLQIALFLEPSLAVNLIFALPLLTAVIFTVFPDVSLEEEIFATFLLEVVTAIFLLYVLLGERVALTVAVLPFLANVTDFLLRVSLVAFCALTVIVQTADLFVPSFDVAVIITFPGLIPLTTPFCVTVATLVLEDFQLTALSVALLGSTVAFRVVFLPL